MSCKGYHFSRPRPASELVSAGLVQRTAPNTSPKERSNSLVALKQLSQSSNRQYKLKAANL